MPDAYISFEESGSCWIGLPRLIARRVSPQGIKLGDLAILYGIETRILNQAVGRNMDRFPEDFMFELTREEIMRISQDVTSSHIKFSQLIPSMFGIPPLKI